MKRKSIFIKSFFRNPKNKISTALITLLLFFTSIISCYYYTTKNYLENDIKKALSYKRLYVQNTDEKENIITTRKELNEIEHIVGVFNESSYFNGITSKQLKNDYVDGTIEIYSATNKTLPTIVYGTNFPDDKGKYLVCPENFYPNGSETSILELNSNAAYNLKKLVGKKITFLYPDLYINKSYKIEFTLVGLYKNNQTNIDESTCYTSENNLHEIFINQNKNDNNFDESLYINFFIQIDKIENIKNVTRELKSKGYIYEYVSSINYDYFENIFSSIKVIVICMTIAIFIIISIIQFKQYKDNKAYYNLLEHIGYEKKGIFTINVVTSIVSITLGFAIHLFALNIVYLCLKFYLEENPFLFNKWTIYLNLNFTILLVIIIVIIQFFCSFLCVYNGKDYASNKNAI